MFRHLRTLSLAAVVVWTVPAFAQSFEGLDLTTESKPVKKKRHRRSKRRHHRRAKPVEPPTLETPAASPDVAAPPASAAPSTPADRPASPPPASSAPAASTAPASPGLGLDLGSPAKPTPPPSGGLGLDLSGNAPQKPAPTMTFEAVDVSGKTAERQKLDAAIAQFKADQYEQSAMSAWDLMNDPKYAYLAGDAQYVLAKSLYRMGMYHSSLGEFSKILKRGQDGKYFNISLEWLFFISHKTVNESVILDEIARYSNFEFPKKFRDEFHYLLARYYFVRGHALDLIDQKGEAQKSMDQVKSLALTVPSTSPFYVRAKYLEGLAYFHDANYTASMNAMKEVVRLTRAGTASAQANAKTNLDLRELAFMQLARIHYGVRQNRYALFYYTKVQRGDPQWLEALFEGAWANYRVGQYEQALGNLITLGSPFFKDEYFPEAMILKAVIYYENCRYRESNAILADFEKTYLPVNDELDALLKKDMDASGLYDVLAEVQRKNKQGLEIDAKDQILERILKLALTDKDLSSTNDSILELEGELDAIGKRSDTFKYSNLSKHLIDALKKERQEMVKKAGVMARSKLEFESGALKTLLGNGLRIRYETTTKEKDFLQAQLRAGGKRDIIKNYKYSVAVADDELYWPYEGEYWRDELGTYQYTLTKGCIDRASRNEAVASSP